MKGSILGLYIASILFSIGCSKVEHGLQTADDIKSSTQNLERDSSNSMRKQKESGAIAAMALAIEMLKESNTSTGRLSHATRYFAAMPFQFIYRDEIRKHYYYKITLGDFLSERFSELSEGRTVKVGDETYPAAKTDITEDYDPNHFPELAALAVRMHYIADDQAEITDSPISFMELLKEVLDGAYKVENCSKCSITDLPSYVQENLQFAGEVVKFFQFAHNTLVIAGLKGVVREPTFGEQASHVVNGIASVVNLNLGQNIQQSLLIKEDTNVKDLQLSIARLERASQIRKWLVAVGVKPEYSNYVFKEKLESFVSLNQGAIENSRLGSSETQQSLNQFFNELARAYSAYDKSLEVQ